MSNVVDHSLVPIRPAATVMLVRDTAEHDGIEVFMLRRTLQAAFAGGMYVFPGGRLDDVDHGPAMEAMCDDLSDLRASELLQIEQGGLAYWVAAIRECFEEAGVLLARSAHTGHEIRFDEADVIDRFSAARHLVHDGHLDLIELCQREGLRLMTDAIFYTAHWVTPMGETRRFDTRFFLARAPHAQEPLHDDSETIASLWVRPTVALERERAGELMMLPPTIACLKFLEPHAQADHALAAAAAVGVPPRILPKVRSNEPGRPIQVVLPGEAGYDDLP
ncbi:MAG: NUDIX domain-containing protein [Actinomycetota bacterium]